MPTERLSMRRIRDLLRLKYAQGLSDRATALSLGLSKGTVGNEISPKVGDAGSGGILKLAQAVAELNPLDDLGQAVPAIELSPFALRRDHQLERHGEAGLAAQTSLGAFRVMAQGGKGAFDRV